MSGDETEELLEAAIEKADERDDEVAGNAFRSMLEKYENGSLKQLTPKQSAWAKAVVAGTRYEPEPEYENLASTGKAPRGREVELMVKDKPLRPPGK